MGRFIFKTPYKEKTNKNFLFFRKKNHTMNGAQKDSDLNWIMKALSSCKRINIKYKNEIFYIEFVGLDDTWYLSYLFLYALSFLLSISVFFCLLFVFLFSLSFTWTIERWVLHVYLCMCVCMYVCMYVYLLSSTSIYIIIIFCNAFIIYRI